VTAGLGGLPKAGRYQILLNGYTAEISEKSGLAGRPDNKFCSMLSVEANRLGWRPHE
jgi:hypothetical protein